MTAPGTAAPPEGRPRSLLAIAPVDLATLAFAGLTILFLAIALVLAAVMPYGDWDAMAFGTWSQLIAEHWPHIHLAGAGPAEYHRPLFYFLQGTAWAIVGFHPAVGRALSLLFSITLLASVAWIAARTAPGKRWFAATLATIVVLLVAGFQRYVSAGLSDIPAAAMVAATAALLLAPRLGRSRLPLVGLAAALAALAKPSALPALVGLAAAVLLGSRRQLPKRAFAAAAIAAGTALGLLYDETQARYAHVSLREFLTIGTSDGFYARLANEARRRALLDGGWLGTELRVVLMFALAYAIARMVVRHRPAVLAAFPVAVVWSWLGPHLSGAHGLRVGILAEGNSLQQIAVLVLAASLLLALVAPEETIPSRLQLARALVWAGPPFLVWTLRVVYDNRLLAPAWPPLVLLMVWALLPAFAGARAFRQWLVLVPATAVVVLAAYSFNNINGLGTSGWSQLRAGGLSGLGNSAFMRGIGLGGDFANELNALAPQLRPNDRILTYDGRLRYFYLSQVDIQVPLSCDQLGHDRIFVLLESDEMRTIYGKPSTSAFWEGCRTLTKVDERPGAYAIFVNGALHPSTGGCGAAAPTPGLAVQFGPSFRTEAAAKPYLQHVVALGFVQAGVEQLGCASYRILETGIPDATVGESILGEARKAGLLAELVNR